MEAEEVERVHLKVPLWAQPPSVTEQSTDLHYGFPGNFPGREEGRPQGLHPSLGISCRVRTTPGAGLPWEPCPCSPFFSPLEPSQPRLSGLAPASGLSRCSLLQPGSPNPGAGGVLCFS